MKKILKIPAGRIGPGRDKWTGPSERAAKWAGLGRMLTDCRCWTRPSRCWTGPSLPDRAASWAARGVRLFNPKSRNPD
ncbi:hypothetical protein CRG98_047575 [Punica granatum]|uniref:Uncharacterized protein n=1 Tax=Punica granatum TaxID=22663 RepID=A0A2I0HK10_PUNGR|nr:hypothetical protein CRG98_047575 [Punica granatum]